MNATAAELPPEPQELVEILAENAYNVAARQRVSDTRPSGRVSPNDTDAEPQRSSKAQHGFPPYKELPDKDKQDYRNTAIETLKMIHGIGYRIERSRAGITPGNKGGQTGAQSPEIIDQINSLNLSSAIATWQARDPDEWKQNPELYRRLGRRVLKLGEPLLAYDVLTEGLKAEPADVLLRQQLGLALARSGATQRGNSILTQLRADGHRDEETLGILARTHKDLWAHAATKPEGNQQLRLAHKFYHEAYQQSRGYYSGINAATLALLLGRNDEARALAQEVRQACVNELKKLPATSGDRY